MSFGTSPLAGLDFDWRSSLVVARRVLEQPPAQSHIERPERRGSLVQRFALPLSCCPTTNRTRHSRPGQQEKTKKLILAMLQVQARSFRTMEPLPGRPQLLCMRLSSVEPDAFSDWAKMAVDLLCLPSGRRKEGMGYLLDDRPKDAEVRQWWEPAKRGSGFVYLEVRA